MVWTSPKTWTAETLTVADMNTHLRDNLEALRNPPSYSYQNSSNYTTTSTSLVSLDSTNMTHSFVLETVGDVLVHFDAAVSNSGGGDTIIELQQDGVAICEGQADSPGAKKYHVAMTILIEGLAAGTYVFTVKWKAEHSTSTLYGGSHNFFVREV